MIFNAINSIVNFLPDKEFIIAKYYLTFKKRLNLKHPFTFNEKINWLKLYDKRELYETFVDKVKVKEYVANKVGAEYIIPTISVYENVKDVKIEELPDKFVIKTTHDSASTFICEDKNHFNFQEVCLKLNHSLATDFSKKFREWPYKYVKPQIIAEKYIETKDGNLMDYKIFCFNGKARFLKVDFNRNTHHQANYYTLSWTLLPFGEAMFPPNPDFQISRPSNFDKMIELAEILAEDIPFVRVDFYNVDNKIFFGELTLFPAAGFGHFIPEKADLDIGHLLRLPEPTNELCKIK